MTITMCYDTNDRLIDASTCHWVCNISTQAIARRHCCHRCHAIAICAQAEPPPPFQRLALTAMNVRVSHRLVVEGGALTEAWAPREVIVSGGKHFIELSRQDRKLQRFIGLPGKDSSPLASNEFFNLLFRKRSEAVDNAIWDYLVANDPLLENCKDKGKILRDRKPGIDDADLPHYVSMDFPAVEFIKESGGTLSCDATSIKCILSLNAARRVCVEALPEVLHYLRVATLASAAVPREKRPPTLSGVHGVCCDKRRKTVYIVHQLPSGEKKRLQKKPLFWQPQLIKQAADELFQDASNQGVHIVDGEPTEGVGEGGDDPAGEVGDDHAGESQGPHESADAAGYDEVTDSLPSGP